MTSWEQQQQHRKVYGWSGGDNDDCGRVYTHGPGTSDNSGARGVKDTIYGSSFKNEVGSVDSDTVHRRHIKVLEPSATEENDEVIEACYSSTLDAAAATTTENNNSKSNNKQSYKNKRVTFDLPSLSSTESAVQSHQPPKLLQRYPRRLVYATVAFFVIFVVIGIAVGGIYAGIAIGGRNDESVQENISSIATSGPTEEEATTAPSSLAPEYNSTTIQPTSPREPTTSSQPTFSGRFPTITPSTFPTMQLQSYMGSAYMTLTPWASGNELLGNDVLTWEYATSSHIQNHFDNAPEVVVSTEFVNQFLEPWYSSSTVQYDILVIQFNIQVSYRPYTYGPDIASHIFSAWDFYLDRNSYIEALETDMVSTQNGPRILEVIVKEGFYEIETITPNVGVDEEMESTKNLWDGSSSSNSIDDNTNNNKDRIKNLISTIGISVLVGSLIATCCVACCCADIILKKLKVHDRRIDEQRRTI